MFKKEINHMPSDKFGRVRPKVILIIDDNQLVSESLKIVFDLEGCTLLTARNHLQAYEIAENQALDIVLCEYDLVKVEGMVFLKSIKKKNPDVINIMFLSISEDNLIPVEYYFWIDQIILKPFNTDTLINKLNQVAGVSNEEVRC